MEMNYEKGTFGYDLNYLSEKDSLILLKSEDEKAPGDSFGKVPGKVSLLRLTVWRETATVLSTTNSSMQVS